jgi:hypothetical protein
MGNISRWFDIGRIAEKSGKIRFILICFRKGFSSVTLRETSLYIGAVLISLGTAPPQIIMNGDFTMENSTESTLMLAFGKAMQTLTQEIEHHNGLESETQSDKSLIMCYKVFCEGFYLGLKAGFETKPN